MDNEYIRWLIYDQAIGLLNMTENGVATMFGISRQTLAKYRGLNDFGMLKIKHIYKLEEHLRLVKANLLVSEVSNV